MTRLAVLLLILTGCTDRPHETRSTDRELNATEFMPSESDREYAELAYNQWPN